MLEEKIFEIGIILAVALFVFAYVLKVWKI